MPSVLANDIIGAQPMTPAASGDVFNLKNPYTVTVKLTKDHYRYFLRAYNRRRYHTIDYIDRLGYPSVKLTRRDDVDYMPLQARIWATKNLKLGSYINSRDTFWFAREKDYTLFLMKWA